MPMGRKHKSRRHKSIFPDPLLISDDFVAMGINLAPETLLDAYHHGIFPWFAQGDPVLWWSPESRFVIFPARIHISRRLRRSIRRSSLRLSLDEDFQAVIRSCGGIERDGQDGTWITPEMEDSYIRLHELGYAHSVEAWMDGTLTGGLYGLSLGGCFYGESMFHKSDDASKIAFSALAGMLIDADYGLIDCQQPTRHLSSFGAISISKNTFYTVLQKQLAKKTHRGSWRDIFPDFPHSRLWTQIHRQD